MMAVPTIRPPSTRAVVEGLLRTLRTDIFRRMRLPKASMSTKSVMRPIMASTA
ncbi:MAG: hypothetical protein A4E31_00179 [Methanomassiliicoccales archaeon PtaU1.Bin030]|nr:MAG: hypothetical protein A4E31_00179 [Methanomassiliicoccales archaeon PtaU1.Bin030]